MKVNTYLTESLLGKILVEWAGEANVTPQARVTGTRMRSDFEVRKGGKVFIVEFEGDSHYRDANVVQRDGVKVMIQLAEGKHVVKIPYFVQLNKQTFQYFFGDSFEIETTFPHGFITSKILPASFCPVGYQAAANIYSGLPLNVQKDIILSLERKAAEIPEQYVFYKTEYDGGSWEEFSAKCREMYGDDYNVLREL